MTTIRFLASVFAIALLAACGDVMPTGVEDGCTEAEYKDGACDGFLGSDS